MRKVGRDLVTLTGIGVSFLAVWCLISYVDAVVNNQPFSTAVIKGLP
jgi:hypothetical protein